MAKGFLIESMIQAKNIDALNRSAISEIDVDGGCLVALTAPTVKGEDRWTASAPTSGKLGNLWMAYNPSVKYISINGKQFAGLSEDIRDYTNKAGTTFDVFKLKKDDEVIISVDCVESTSQASVVAGDFLEAKAGQTTFTRVASGTGATAGSTALKVELVDTVDFPKASIGVDKVKVFKAVVVQE